MRFCPILLVAIVAAGCASSAPTPAAPATSPVPAATTMASSPMLAPASGTASASMPALPATSGAVTLQVQDGADKPARDLVITIYYPGDKLANVNAGTGIMEDLHNWGGLDFDGAPNPLKMANQLNVVSFGVRYYQSHDPDKGPIPYDFGYIQAWDALRGLQYVYNALDGGKIAFDKTRIYGCGGSGGGNVIEMANKFAPHTYACIVDLSGMASLTDDMAYNMPGGSLLNGRYSRDPASPAYLTKDMQEIRDIGNPAHLAQMAKAGDHCTVVMIHGNDDPFSLASDSKRVAAAMQAAGLDIQTHFFAKSDIDGKLVTNTGHSIGDRTALLLHFAGDYLTPGSPKLRHLAGAPDFVRRDKVSYRTDTMMYVMDYSSGAPVLSSQPLTMDEMMAKG